MFAYHGQNLGVLPPLLIYCLQWNYLAFFNYICLLFFAELRVCLSWSEAGCPTPTCVRVSRGRLQMSSNRECQPEPGHIGRIRSWKNRKHKVHSSKYCLFRLVHPPFDHRKGFWRYGVVKKLIEN